VMFAWAFADPSIWSLIAGLIASSMARTLASHLWLPGTKNVLFWEWRAFNEIIKFGKWIFFSSALFFFASNGDRIVLGGLVDASTLGSYVVAYMLFSSVDQAVSKIIVDVSFPALSEIIRLKTRDLNASYYKFHAIIASCTYFGAAALMVAGQMIVALLYDARYQQAGWILQILSIALFTIPVRIATQCFLALGVERIYFLLHAVRIVVLFVAMPVGFYLFGFPGAVYGIVLSYFSTIPMTFIYAKKYEMFNVRKEVLALVAIVPGIIAGGLLNLAISAIIR
jgi:O-antigen/teichoic acid export membrane protein